MHLNGFSRFFKTLVLSGLVMVIAGCSSGFCRKLNRSKERPPNFDNETKVNSKLEGKILIYKYDGSLQCERKRAISLEQMEKELNKIKVFSREKKHDGLMHIQACGAPTGKANVYQINAKDIGQAEKYNFKIWNF